MNNQIYISDFYCTQCGNRSLPIPRQNKQQREPGHLKKLWCPHCQITCNMAEVRPFGKYTLNEFLIEYKYGNFNEEGLRVDPSYKHFIATLRDKGELDNEE